MSESLKEQVIIGTGWSAVERFATQGANFLIQLVLARLLMPEDYGAIAMLAIFLQIAQVFIDSGFANALIKKLDCKEEDYSTVFYYNLAVAGGIYLLFWWISPQVASFYNLPILTNVMRVISLTLIINALSIVQRTMLVKQIDFKTQTIVSISSVFISGLFGICMAYKGLGVWALCGQAIINSIMQFVFLSYYVRWVPRFAFCMKSFHEMFSFGSKLLVSSIIHVVYNNLYTIVIGKRFESSTLGLFSRADQFASFPSTNIGQIIARVTLPVLSKIQNNNESLILAYRKIIRYGSLIVSPLMLGLCVIAQPLILVLLTEKWIGIVPFLQILCIGFVVDHLNGLNLNLLYVKGRSDLVLKLEIIKKAIAIAILFGTMPFGIMVMCIGRAIYSFIAVLINSYYTNRLIKLSVWRQLQDVLPYLVSSILMAVVMIVSIHFIENSIVKLIVGSIVGSIVYSILSFVFFRSDVRELINVIQK